MGTSAFLMKIFKSYAERFLALWAYSFQTFSAGEVLLATKMNQIEVNIRDHVHAADGVVVLYDRQTFTSSDTWSKPSLPSTSLVLVECWGAGGSGARDSGTDEAGGGGGGTYVYRWMLLSELGSTETVTIGAGGAAQASDNTNGNNGGNTTFGSHLTGYGGGGGKADGSVANSGGIDGVATGMSTASTPGIMLGGAGAGTGVGGDSFMGGGGGGGSSGSGAGGTSVGGGNGGAGSQGTGTAGTQPGGGGGGGRAGASGAGANGQCRVTVFAD